jgi:hypothetical protein
LPAPTENLRRAFCTRTCHARFYRSRCLVCEDEMQRKQENQRFKSGHGTCKAEYRRFPHVYDWPKASKPVEMPACSSDAQHPLRSAHSTGLKSAHNGDRPKAHCLREWRWGGDPENGDHSLYDRDGLTIARIVLVGGRYHLRSPIATPRQSWSDLDAAKRAAECIALMAMPLDPKVAARIKKDNATPHPMGAAAQPATEVWRRDVGLEAE